MRTEVYVKFAEALTQNRPAFRQQLVHLKFAEAPRHQTLKKTAAVRRRSVYVKLAAALCRPSVKKAAPQPMPVPSPSVPEPVTSTTPTSALQAQSVTAPANDPIQMLRTKLRPYLTPANAGGAALGLGGGLAIYNALTGKKSMGSRFLQGLLGSLMAYGGYKAFSDPRFRTLINQGGLKTFSALKDYAGKALSGLTTSAS